MLLLDYVRVDAFDDSAIKLLWNGLLTFLQTVNIIGHF